MLVGDLKNKILFTFFIRLRKVALILKEIGRKGIQRKSTSRSKARFAMHEWTFENHFQMSQVHEEPLLLNKKISAIYNQIQSQQVPGNLYRIACFQWRIQNLPDVGGANPPMASI